MPFKEPPIEIILDGGVLHNNADILMWGCKKQTLRKAGFVGFSEE
jgi:hypothetical protein